MPANPWGGQIHFMLKLCSLLELDFVNSTASRWICRPTSVISVVNVTQKTETERLVCNFQIFTLLSYNGEVSHL